MSTPASNAFDIRTLTEEIRLLSIRVGDEFQKFEENDVEIEPTPEQYQIAAWVNGKILKGVSEITVDENNIRIAGANASLSISKSSGTASLTANDILNINTASI